MSDWIEKVHAHADGELNDIEAAEVQRIMAEDPQAAAEHQWAVYIRETLRSKHVRPDHAEAWAKAKERLDAIDALEGDGKASAFIGRHSWKFAAGLFAVILFAGFLNRGNPGGELSSQDLAGLFSVGSLSQQQDVQGAQDADTYAKQNFNAPLPTIDPVIRVHRVGQGTHEGVEFLRVDMSDNSGPMQMFVFKGVTDFDGLEPVPGRGEYVGGMVSGENVVGWSSGDMAYLLMCDRSTEELVSIADQMQR